MLRSGPAWAVTQQQLPAALGCPGQGRKVAIGQREHHQKDKVKEEPERSVNGVNNSNVVCHMRLCYNAVSLIKDI